MKNLTNPVVNRTVVALAAAFFLSSCANLQPTNYSATELLAQAKKDKAAAFEAVEPIGEALTLDEALARALKYNLDRRSKMMEEALAARQLDVTQLDMLPRLTAQAGYTARDNDRISVSRDAVNGTPVTSRFISQDRSHTLYDLGMTWSLLDFGMGYSNSLQQADRLLIAVEKRRKAMHLLMQDVRIAFWRAASAQKLRDQVRGIIVMAEEALTDSRQVEAQRIRNPVDSLRYQRQLLENLRLLEAIDQELSVAHIELAALINAPIGRVLKIAEPQVGPDSQVLSVPLDFMEELAMTENADTREQNYNARVAREEIRKTLMRLFPNVSFSYAVKYDTDNYLVNKGWNEAGLQLSYNIVNLFTAPIQKRLAEAGVALADQRRISMQMAVIAQVHLARQQVANAVAQFNRADAIWQTDSRISEVMANRQTAQAQSKLEVVSNQTATVLSLLRRYQALSQVQAAEARLQATVGLEPKIGSVGELKLSQLQQQVAQSDGLAALFQAREKARLEAQERAAAAEAARLKAEEDKAAEKARLKVEADKKAAEEAAAKVEADKKAAEDTKLKAEADKKAAEDTKTAEDARLKAETDKKAAEEATAKAEADKKITDGTGVIPQPVPTVIQARQTPGVW